MVFFDILEPVLAILFIAFLVSQCLVPEVLGQPWFPIFRRAWRLRTDIAQAREDISTGALAGKLDELRHTAKGETHAVSDTEERSA
jgi:hypothetical protein